MLEIFLDYKAYVQGRSSNSLQELKHAFSTPYSGGSSLKPLLSTKPRFAASSASQMPTEKEAGTAVQKLKTMLQQQKTLEKLKSDVFRQHTLTRSPTVRTGPPRHHLSTDDDSGAVSNSTRLQLEPGTRLDDIIPFVSSQSSYIQQLEGENTFCKDELTSLRSKMQSVVDDNVRLYEELKTVVVKLELDQREKEQDNKHEERYDTDVTTGKMGSPVKPGTPKSKDSYSKLAQELEQMKSLHDAKTNRLEAQLAYTRSEMDKYETQCGELRSKLRRSESVNLMMREDTKLENGLCVRCAQHEAVIASTHGSTHVKALERVTNERDELMNTLTRLRASMTDLKQREANTYNQVKKSVTLVEQAQLEKTALLVQREQLKDDQHRSQQRIDEMIQEHQQRLAQERQLTRKEGQYEMGQLNQKIAKLTDDLAAAHNQIERTTRDKVAMSSELDQCRLQIAQHTHEVTQASQGVQLTTTTAKVQRDDAVRQLQRLRVLSQRDSKDREQETDRLKKELSDLRRRLGMSENELTTSREECIKLTRTLNLTEREASQAKLARDLFVRSKDDDVEMLTRKAQQREMELHQTIQQVQATSAMKVNNLDDLAANQSTLIYKLREEGRTLTEQLDHVTNKYRAEIKRLKHTNRELSSRSDRLATQHAELEAQCLEHGKSRHKMTSRIQQMEESAQRSAQQIYELLEKQKSLMQERTLLRKEMDFLFQQQQLNIPPVDTRDFAAGLDLTPELDVNVFRHVSPEQTSND